MGAAEITKELEGKAPHVVRCGGVRLIPPGHGEHGILAFSLDLTVRTSGSVVVGQHLRQHPVTQTERRVLEAGQLQAFH